MTPLKWTTFWHHILMVFPHNLHGFQLLRPMGEETESLKILGFGGASESRGLNFKRKNM